MVNDIRVNAPVPGVPFFSPVQSPSPGTAKQLHETTPTLFRPLKIRGITLRNRFWVSPMCQYSCAPTGSQTGVLTPLHVTILGQYAYKGAALVMLEATGVQPNGRISVNCPGLWNDTQMEALKTVADLIRAQGGLSGIQLSHAGRKASTTAPWVAARLGKSSVRAESAEGGWPDNVVGPMGGSANTWDGKSGNDPAGGFNEPRQLSEQEIADLVVDWAKAAKRAATAGVDVVEIHAAHGYLLHQFLSPITNRRNDKYGGNFEKNTRLLVEVIQAVRTAIPETMPLVVRISASEWLEETDLGKQVGTWDLDSTIRLAKMLPGLGVDVLDVSSGANHPQARYNVFNAGKQQAEMATKIRKEVKQAGIPLQVGVVGMIEDAKQARDLVQDDKGNAAADFISVGRQFLRDPAWVLRVAEELDVDVAWPIQTGRARLNRTDG